MKSVLYLFLFAALLACTPSKTAQIGTNRGERDKVLEIIHTVNDYWQGITPVQQRAFWDVAAYHTGNMAAWELTKHEPYLNYSLAWAEHNKWMGATGTDTARWKYSYGETMDYVLFGDWQICFQVYADLYKIHADPVRIARARQVMEYQMSTARNDYWWWVDGLYMVMPVMTRLYQITGNELYTAKLYEYLQYTDSVMYDAREGLYYRDAKYLYPKHTTIHGLKDFWARGNGWAFAGLARVLADLPLNHKDRPAYIQRFTAMANAIVQSSRPAGYWTRSLLDSAHAPGPETSGTAFFNYGLYWGINHGILSEAAYKPTADNAWNYLTQTALQPNGRVGYVQPIGEKAIPGQVIDKESTANFGVGAFLLAAVEKYKNLQRK